ncbi:uncharacterized protein A1O5_12408 [Cladophialophora psammophila CBS 110553]|uniref:Alcohol dehydrogenase-like N-terminal domain-containing protein n=1 Tax=Cladophialophora psammophila CBS 110553 TaxID=1182543 RepID=W9VYT1_9EURO|nr:uncharacterized protein A1O5_12408 [Cladophialophora psammophila CBS 110553]EXJ57850.1 hypothetical protein A1O5_12408 [Cladophialophora psammophila CBS 110553]
MASDLPCHHRALVLEAVGAGFETKKIPMPSLDAGSAIVQVLSAGVRSYHREIYNGQRHYNFPKLIVGGISAIARIAAVGPDAVALHAGQLVFADCKIHARDDPDSLFVTAIHEGMNDRSKKLITDVWRDGVFAQYAKIPLENCIPLDETKLCRQLGYTTNDLMDIKLEPGETVVVCPATGGFGGAGVQVAVAMGARVIAMGRDEEELARLSAHIKSGTPRASIETVKLTGDLETDTVALQAFGTIDAVIDFTPPFACKSTHLKSAVEDVIDYKVMALNITLKGKLMYEREDVVLFVKMLESGLFPRGKDFADVKAFAMEDWNEALDTAAEHIGIGKVVVIEPWS